MTRVLHGPRAVPIAEFRRILLVKPSSLGDVIHAIPVLHGLRVRYPTAKIDWLIGSSFAAILEGNNDVSELIEFDRKRFSRLGVSPAAMRDFLRLIQTLRSRRYDLVVDLQGLFRSAFLTRVTGAPVRIGFANAREGAPWFYTHLIPITDADEHAVDRNMHVADALGNANWPVVFDLGLDDGIRSSVRDLLRENGVQVDSKLLAVAPGARWETKAWPWQNFVAAVDELGRSGPVQIVLLGGSEDLELCRKIAEHSQARVISLAGKTSLRQMVAVIERCDVLLCHDSAPMHVAAALNRPLVCLIGPTNPARTGPYRRIHDVLRLSLTCSPCYLRTLAECGFEHQCMRDLRVSDVVGRVKALLDTAHPTRHDASCA